jgi:multidrug efflux pump subunit AcrB
VTPAFVSLLCICIVFVPMFFLQGVARFLFVPMAEAVMFAMIWSFILSRTLVPTMANYLLQPHVASCRRARAAAVAQSAGALPARLRGAVRALPRRLPRSAVDGAGTAAAVRDRLPRPSSRSFLLVPFSAATSFPSVDAGRS